MPYSRSLRRSARWNMVHKFRCGELDALRLRLAARFVDLHGLRTGLSGMRRLFTANLRIELVRASHLSRIVVVSSAG